MNQPPKTGKRIVSQGEYISVQTSRTLLSISTLATYITVAVCVFLAVSLPFSGFGIFGLLASLFCTVMALRFIRFGQAKRKRAAQMEQVVPLSHVNIADLPDEDRLVRASEEPVSEQQNVLLRPAVSNEETPAEQLLRASSGHANTVQVPTSDSLVHVSNEPAQEQQDVSRYVTTQEPETLQEQRIRS